MGMIEILSSTDTVMHYVNCVADVYMHPLLMISVQILTQKAKVKVQQVSSFYVHCAITVTVCVSVP